MEKYVDDFKKVAMEKKKTIMEGINDNIELEGCVNLVTFVDFRKGMENLKAMMEEIQAAHGLADDSSEYREMQDCVWQVWKDCAEYIKSMMEN